MELRRFDLLFVRGDTPIISRLVQRVTRSPYSHVAVIRGPDSVYETNWWYPLQARFIKYPRERYDVYRYQGELTLAQQQAMENFINMHLGAGYDLTQSLTHGIYLLTGYPIRDDAKRFNCSEFVDRMFAAAGIDLFPAVNGHVTPGDLTQSDKLIRIA